MKGYFEDKRNGYTPVTEDALVGCQRCKHTWYEKVTFFLDIRINGPMYKYDYCDNCITEEDKNV